MAIRELAEKDVLFSEDGGYAEIQWEDHFSALYGKSLTDPGVKEQLLSNLNSYVKMIPSTIQHYEETLLSYQDKQKDLEEELARTFEVIKHLKSGIQYVKAKQKKLEV